MHNNIGEYELKYVSVLNDISSDTFQRRDVLDALLRTHPDYNVSSFSRHFSKLLSYGAMENVGEDLYIKVSHGTAKELYTYKTPGSELIDVKSFLCSEFPLADFLVWETIQLNEFINHQIAQNTIIVMIEHMLMDAAFERLKGKFPTTLFSPTPMDYMRYGRNGTIAVQRLSYRYPKNPKQKHGYSIEKLIVDLFAEKIINSFVNADDYPAALETAFMRYRINETRLFNYARTRRVDAEIQTMIREQTAIRLYTDKG